MGITKTLGGDRIGSGNKQKVFMHGYERSTHDLSYLWRSTMSAGTLVPFMSKVALPGDTFDISLNCDVKTHPTVGPLFGSYKVQLDIFECPIRLYNALLHNNALGIGMSMSKVKFPTITYTAQSWNSGNPNDFPTDLDNSQFNPSSLPSYLGLRGVGLNNTGAPATRDFNAIPTLAYWEIYKQYYSAKNEEIGAVLHTPSAAIIQLSAINWVDPSGASQGLSLPPNNSQLPLLSEFYQLELTGIGGNPDPNTVLLNTSIGQYRASDLFGPTWTNSGTNTIVANYGTFGKYGSITLYNYQMASNTTINTGKPSISTFPLTNIDDMRNAILAFQSTSAPFNLNTNGNKAPYNYLWQQPNNIPNVLSSQEGLALKTYQSDLFNNWLKTEWIDGPTGVNELSKIDTSTGSFKIDTFIIAKKVYDVLNRVAISGGTYDDWLEVTYDHKPYGRAENPMYHGGLSKELVFQEVVSNSQTAEQPLGTLAGRGVMGNKHKGGHVTIKVSEPGYIIGIISLTPRIDYSQGNSWDQHLKTMDDLHKPGLDQIGFQEFMIEDAFWPDTQYIGGSWLTRSAGKQPAWIHYMTSVNEVRGNFAVGSGNQVGEMFMTLNRRYELDKVTFTTKDLTTYIDPSKYNNIFAETALDAQNFWAQIAVNITARRKMSAKIIPSL